MLRHFRNYHGSGAQAAPSAHSEYRPTYHVLISFHSNLLQSVKILCCVIGDLKTQIDEAILNFIVMDSQPFKVDLMFFFL